MKTLLDIYYYHRTKYTNVKTKTILLFNPGMSTLNLGDQVISDACSNQLSGIFPDSMQVNLSSHIQPSSVGWTRNWSSEFSFVCGSNLMSSSMFLKRRWNISFLDAIVMKKSILLGVGWNNYENQPSTYTKYLYKYALSDDYIHSVRDRYTYDKLKSIGVKKVLNTGCPTMWSLTPEHCKDIPNHKSNSVVFTITDYRKDPTKDSDLIDSLLEIYENVYFWPQGSFDLDYFNSLSINKSRINVLKPTLKDFDNVLKQDIDFVGTRLHAGVRALQYKRRTLIIAVDNRAEEKRKDFNLPVISRDISKGELSKSIAVPFEVNINIDIESINKWKSQFYI